MTEILDFVFCKTATEVVSKTAAQPAKEKEKKGAE